MANPRDNSQFVPSGEHPLLEWPREDVEWLDGDGLRFRDVVTLEDAPGFCVPWRFDACFDDPGYPVVIRLTIVNGEFVEAVLKPRLDRNPELIKIDGGSAWIGRAPCLPVGSIPEIPASRLLRDALARAAMPVERPLVSEVNRHTREVAAALPIRRAQRYSHHELAVIRSAYSEALLAGITTKNAQREHVFDALCAAFPELYWRTPASSNRRTPDGEFLRPVLARIECEFALRSAARVESNHRAAS